MMMCVNTETQKQCELSIKQSSFRVCTCLIVLRFMQISLIIL